MTFCYTSAFAGMNDNPNGFFTVYERLFNTLDKEEADSLAQQGIDHVKLATFGASTSPDNVVRNFYSTWSRFSTQKEFWWVETSFANGTDRFARRVIEKENKKLKETAIKDFNKAVRHLIEFLKRRDFRHIQRQESSFEREQALLERSRTQAQMARARFQAGRREYVEPSWAKAERHDEAVDEYCAASDSAAEEFECVVCGKYFKSEKAYESHEKSKKTHQGSAVVDVANEKGRRRIRN